MWYAIQPTIKEEEEDPYSFISMPHALKNVDQSQPHVECQPLESCLNLVKTEKKTDMLSSMASILRPFLAMSTPLKAPNDLI